MVIPMSSQSFDASAQVRIGERKKQHGRDPWSARCRQKFAHWHARRVQRLWRHLEASTARCTVDKGLARTVYRVHMHIACRYRQPCIDKQFWGEDPSSAALQSCQFY